MIANLRIWKNMPSPPMDLLASSFEVSIPFQFRKRGAQSSLKTYCKINVLSEFLSDAHVGVKHIRYPKSDLLNRYVVKKQVGSG